MPESLTFRCAACGALNRVPEARVAAGPRCGRCRAALGGGPAELDDEALDRLLAGAPVPVLVDFYAPWCGPCKAMAPQLDALARRHAGRLIVVKVDTDRHPRHARALGVRAVPTLALWRGGAWAKVQPGALMGPALEAFVSG